MTTVIWHDYPNNGEPTSCCGRLTKELPLGDGRTSAAERVTCNGSFEPAVHAHDLYPHPSEYADEPPALEDAARYHIARSLAMYPAEFDGGSRQWMSRINLMLAERQIACLTVALDKGLAGQAALDWAHAHSSGDDGELIYDLAREYGVQLERIKSYAMPAQEVAAL